MRRIVSFCISLAMLCACFTAARAEEREKVEFTDEEFEYLDDIRDENVLKSSKFIIKYKDNTVEKQKVLNFFKSFSDDKEQINKIRSLTKNEDMNIIECLDGYSCMELTEEVDADDFVRRMSENDDIEFIQPVYDFYINELEENNTANMQAETAFEAEIGDFEPSEPQDEAGTDTEQAASRSGVADEETVVALIDTGIDIYHNEIRNNILSSESHNVLDDNHTVYDAEWGNDMAHGTHLAGVISGVDGNNSENNNIKIMAIRAFTNGNSNTIDLVEAIEYAVRNGAKIINCSWGCSRDDAVLRNIIEDNPEVLFVCSAGNGGKNIDENPVYPAAYDLPNILTVASVNTDDGLSYFSNYGTECVDVAACGRNIESTYPGNRRGMLSGTSVANAFVTRAAARLLESNNELTCMQLKEKICNSSDKLSSLSGYVNGERRINLSNAFCGIYPSELTEVEYVPDVIVNKERTEQENWELFRLYDNVKIATGGNVSLLLMGDGSVWSWGDNQYGQAGTGNTNQICEPERIECLNGILDICVTDRHCVALKYDGTVWAWGSNQYGQLGISSGTSSFIPMQVLGLQNVESISAGYNNSAAVDHNGNIWTWGANNNGQLGRDGVAGSANIVTTLQNMTEISVGNNFCAALDNNGHIWTWGSNTYGQLGNNTKINQSQPVDIGGGYKDVRGGGMHCLAITTDNKLYGWGFEGDGQLGFYDEDNDIIIPQYAGVDDVKQISAGYDYSLILKNNNKVYACGSNDYGKLGIDSDAEYCENITEVEGIANVSSISAGHYHSGAICDYKLFMWGSNKYFELCDDSQLNSFLPLKTNLKNIINVSAGNDFSVAADSLGRVWTWGHNNHYQLGNGGYKNSEIPVNINISKPIVKVSAGYYHCMALDNEGCIWGWGTSNFGQIGISQSSVAFTPIKISGISGVADVVCGSYHTLILKNDGTVWACGRNRNGQVGDGTTTNVLTPVQLTGLSNIISIAAGSNFSMALKSDGSIWTWGANTYGQLGTGDTVSRYTPVSISSIPNINSIYAGATSAYALTNTGHLYTWGGNTFGQLGNGTYTHETYPVLLNSNITFDYVSGRYNSCIITDTDGNVISWGNNADYQLGVGGDSFYNMPQATGINEMVTVEIGNTHCLAIDTEGNLWAWGGNDYGQLGTRRTLYRKKPYYIMNYIYNEQFGGFDFGTQIYADTRMYFTYYSHYTGSALYYYVIPQYTGNYRIIVSDELSAEVYEKNNGSIRNIGYVDSVYMEYPNEYGIKITSQTGNTQSFYIEVNGEMSRVLGRAFETDIANDKYYANTNDGGRLYKNQSLLESTQNLGFVSWLCNYDNILYFNAEEGLKKISGSGYVDIAEIDARYIVSDGDNIYFSNWSDSGKIYRGELLNNGEMEFTKVCEDSAAWLQIDGEWIYYRNLFDGSKRYKVTKNSEAAAAGIEVDLWW